MSAEMYVTEKESTKNEKNAQLLTQCACVRVYEC